MTRLSEIVQVDARYAVASNVERDADGPSISEYLPTARSLDVLRRFAHAAADPARRRAWSITGPYGSGKSSLALLIDALAGPTDALAFRDAARTLESIDPDLVENLRGVHSALSRSHRGFIRAVVTAEPEPITLATIRALSRGAHRYWSRGRRPGIVAKLDVALEETRAGKSTPPTRIVELAAELAAYAPVLVVIDEFGKTLDYQREFPGSGDLYVLQALVEASAGISGIPLFFLTLQHMSFDDYAPASSMGTRREWAKVQGRFEDVAYVDTPDQTVGLISRVFNQLPGKPQARVQDWAQAAANRCRDLGLSKILGDQATLARCYPLHPVTLAVLPELCRHFGQNERTLFGFLTHDEPHAVGRFVESTTLSGHAGLPAVLLPDVYDYFIGSVSTSIGVSESSRRWFEINQRISQAAGLSSDEQSVLKTVGVLNLVAQGGTLRASDQLVAFALSTSDDQGSGSLPVTLGGLVRKGFLTRREFADEYRVWQGSDFNIEQHLGAATARLSSLSTAELIETASVLKPVVAGRHSQTTGTVRVFRRTVSDHGEASPDAQGLDGTITYTTAAAPAAGTTGGDDLPRVVAIVPNLGELRRIALEARAYREILDAPESSMDWVAQRELQERAAVAHSRLVSGTESMTTAVSAAWLLSSSQPIELGPTRSASELASAAADRCYSATPLVRNELLGRSSLTSQAARARVQLLEAMVSSPAQERLGIDGFGPDRAMYEAILARPGIHRAGDGGWLFGAPDSEDSYSGVWDRLSELIESSADTRVRVADVAVALERPPWGIKAPLFPILLTAHLLSNPDQVAIYQDGTFQPRLSGDLLERLTKAPSRFELRHLALRGRRLGLLKAFAVHLGLTLKSSTKQRGAPVLSVVGPLLGVVRDLPEFVQHSTDLSASTIRVRDAVSRAREPDVLLFEDIPSALGFDPSHDQFDAESCASALREAVDELTGAYGRLLEMVAATIATGIALDPRNSLKVEAAARARPLIGHVVEPRLRAALFAMTSDALDDDDWLEAVGLAISERPPRMWDQLDADRFGAIGDSLFATFRRVESLHFDARAQPSGEFEARKITVTAPDGTEHARVVWRDTRSAAALRPIAEAARNRARELFPSGGSDALLATLAEQVFGTPEGVREGADQTEGDHEQAI